jgi:hypothetical protein
METPECQKPSVIIGQPKANLLDQAVDFVFRGAFDFGGLVGLVF